MSDPQQYHGTTILAVRHRGHNAVGGDGQVTLGETVIKQRATKVRRLSGGVVAGFAGSAADALGLLERFEKKLAEHSGQLRRAAVELAKEWRTDRALRRLEATLVLADREALLLVSGQGDVIEPDDGVLAVGSGASVARAAALALLRHAKLDARHVVEAALKVAGEICIYTNSEITVEEVE